MDSGNVKLLLPPGKAAASRGISFFDQVDDQLPFGPALPEGSPPVIHLDFAFTKIRCTSIWNACAALRTVRALVLVELACGD